jgi:hypothetical protein
MPKDKFYDLQPGAGSHHLLYENGVPIARFNELEKAKAVRARYMAEIAEIHDRNAESNT